jgi:predicted ribosomally synthesized peptide with nif11-like leader
MSREDIVEFMNQVAESVELQATIGEEIDTEALIALGAECGCEFTAEELQESAGLSDEELDGVAGGVDHPGGLQVGAKVNTYKYHVGFQDLIKDIDRVC